MARVPDTDASYKVTCPHCRKDFEGTPSSGSAARFTGFKCPHCRLFVPFERAAEQDRLEQLD